MTIENEMFSLMKDLYPICRSITGNGVRETLNIIKQFIELDVHEIPSGTRVFDWIVPKEWNIKDAYVLDPSGKKIIDFRQSNLHVVNYSIPIRKKMNFSELKQHLHTIPNQPDLIPYVTSYYKENWGFCLPHKQFLELQDGEYDVCIDSSLTNGSLTFGEYLIKGESDDEVLISVYVCHPSLCNDNLSGVVLTTFLAQRLKKMKLHYSYRFLFIPETIGAITWLSINEQNLSKIKHGLVVTCVGDKGNFTYKKSRNGNSEIDKIVINVLKNSETNYNIKEFFPYGSDERQFCSPGFNLPMGVLMRTQYYNFSEYHTSGDNLSYVSQENLGKSLEKYFSIIFAIEGNFAQSKNIKQSTIELTKPNLEKSSEEIYINLNPKCEPQLGNRGLYHSMGKRNFMKKSVDTDKEEIAVLWVLNFSDGNFSLDDISKKSEIDLNIIKSSAKSLQRCGLLKKISNN